MRPLSLSLEALLLLLVVVAVVVLLLGGGAGATPAIYAGCATPVAFQEAPTLTGACALCTACAGTFTALTQANVRQFDGDAGLPTCVQVTTLVQGDVRLSDSATCVQVDAGGAVLGDVRFGSGADCLLLTTGAYVRGDVDMRAGADVVVVNGGDVDGDVRTGDGADTLEVASAASGEQAQLDGTVELGDGADSAIVLGVNAVTLLGELRGGDGADTLQVGDGVLVKAVDGGDDGDTVAVAEGVVAELVRGGDGDDTMFVYGATSVTATAGAGPGAIVRELSAGDGNDCVALNHDGAAANAKQLGRVSLGDGDDTLAAWNNFAIDDDLELGDGDDVVELRDGVLNGDASFGKGVATITLSTATGPLDINGDVKARSGAAHALTVTGTALIRVNGGVRLGGASDTTATCTFDAGFVASPQALILVADGIYGCTASPSLPGTFGV